MIDLIVNNVVVILTVVFLVLMGIWGRHRGLIRMITSTAAMLISLFIARGFMKKVAEKMQQRETLVEWVENSVLPKLKGVQASTVFNALAFLGLFVITMILVRILAATLDKLSERGLLSVINQVLGLVLGLVEAIGFLWIFMIFVDVMPQLPFCEFVSKQIAASQFLSTLHDNNLIVLFVQSIL